MNCFYFQILVLIMENTFTVRWLNIHKVTTFFLNNTMSLDIIILKV